MRLIAMGHDAVAYFTDNDAVPGNPAIQAEHLGVTWRFASEANKARGGQIRDLRPRRVAA